MADLIERDAVLAEIGEFQIRFNETGDSHERVAYATAEHCMLVIKAAPTIEPEVRRGRWIEATKHRDENGTILTDYECSECCAMVKDSDAEEIGSERFCYNCGADMREGGADI